MSKVGFAGGVASTPGVGAYILTRRCAACGHRNCVIFGRCRECDAPLGAALMEKIDGEHDHSLPIGEDAKAVLARVSGTKGATDFFPLAAQQCVVGSDSGGPFSLDPYIVSRHCRVTVSDEGVIVEDLSEACGVFAQAAPEGSALRAQDMIRLGEQLLRVDMPGGIVERARLTVVAGSAPEDASFAFGARETTRLGRIAGEMTFPHDHFLADEHAEIRRRKDGFYLFDLDTVNGTFVRVHGPHLVPFGGRLFIGQLLFAVLEPSTIAGTSGG